MTEATETSPAPTFYVGQRVRVLAASVDMVGRFAGRTGTMIEPYRGASPRLVCVSVDPGGEDASALDVHFYREHLEPIESEWLPGSDPRVREWEGMRVEVRLEPNANGGNGLPFTSGISYGVTQSKTDAGTVAVAS